MNAAEMDLDAVLRKVECDAGRLARTHRANALWLAVWSAPLPSHTSDPPSLPSPRWLAVWSIPLLSSGSRRLVHLALLTPPRHSLLPSFPLCLRARSFLLSLSVSTSICLRLFPLARLRGHGAACLSVQVATVCPVPGSAFLVGSDLKSTSKCCVRWPLVGRVAWL